MSYIRPDRDYPEVGDIWSGSWTSKPVPWADVPHPGDYWMENYPGGIQPCTWVIEKVEPDHLVLRHAGSPQRFPPINAPVPKDWVVEKESWRWVVEVSPIRHEP